MSQVLTLAVEMNELRRKVNFVRHGLGASKTDLGVMLIRAVIAGTKMILFAANKENFARTEVKISRPDAEEAGDGTFALMGAKLERLISQVDAEQVQFKADTENLEVQAGFLTVNFELFDGAILRTVEAGLAEHLTMDGLALDREAFEEALSCAKSCSTTTSVRPDVTHAELRKGRLLSSDGRKIMIYSHQSFPEEATFKCPATALPSIIGCLKNADAQSIQIIEGASYYFIKANRNEYTLGVRKVERTFPAVEGQITKNVIPDDEISVDKNVLEAMLKGVALGLPSDEVRVTISAGGEGKSAYLEAAALNNLGRKSHERASAGRKKGAPADVAFPVSFKHLLDTLSVFKGDSVVDMMVMLKKNLLMVRDTTDAREVVTVIPFRTDRQVEDEKKEREAAEVLRKKETEAAKAEAAAGPDLVEGAVRVELLEEV